MFLKKTLKSNINPTLDLHGHLSLSWGKNVEALFHSELVFIENTNQQAYCLSLFRTQNIHVGMATE